MWFLGWESELGDGRPPAPPRLCSPSLRAPADAEPDGGRAERLGGRVALAGQHSAKRKPLLRGQPHHGPVGPHRRALLLQVSRPRRALGSLPSAGGPGAQIVRRNRPLSARLPQTPGFSTADSADPRTAAVRGALAQPHGQREAASASSEPSLPGLPLGPASGPASSSSPCFRALAAPSAAGRDPFPPGGSQ